MFRGQLVFSLEWVFMEPSAGKRGQDGAGMEPAAAASQCHQMVASPRLPAPDPRLRERPSQNPDPDPPALEETELGSSPEPPNTRTRAGVQPSPRSPAAVCCETS